MDWRSTVRVTRHDSLGRELLARRPADATSAAVRVTDLLDLRPAFYRSRVALPVSPKRRARQEVGRDLHVLLGGALAPPGQFELRFQRDGMVGQLDWLDEGPTELKTTEGPLPPEVEVAARTGYLDQLAMYCALVDRPSGRLLVVETADGAPKQGMAIAVEYTGADGIRAEMHRRAALLREAFARGEPDRLPRCAWFGRGCEFQQARLCRCTGSEIPAVPIGEHSVESIALDEGRTSRLNGVLTAIAAGAGRRVVRRFRDLTYPRRVYFERRREVPSEPTVDLGPSPERRALFRSLIELIESGPPGEVTRVPLGGDGPIEAVSCLQGRPYLVKSTGVRSHYSDHDLLARQPQYLLELGLRCAALGRPDGWLVVAYERAGRLEQSLDAFEVEFDPMDAILEESRHRASALAEALAHDRPEVAPACPSWMFAGCPYRDECACGTDAGAPTTGRNR